MNTRDAAPKVALYWDFENFHAILANLEFGEHYYRENRFTPQSPLVDLSPVLEYAASLGDITINRAYGNWQWFASYRHQLNAAGVDLIQMFPRGQHMKNSADIRLVAEIEFRFDERQRVDERGPPAFHLPPQRAPGNSQGLSPLRLGLGVDQVGEPREIAQRRESALDAAHRGARIAGLGDQAGVAPYYRCSRHCELWRPSEGIPGAG